MGKVGCDEQNVEFNWNYQQIEWECGPTVDKRTVKLHLYASFIQWYSYWKNYQRIICAKISWKWPSLLEKMILKFLIIIYSRYFTIISSWKRPFIWLKLNSLHLRMIGWNARMVLENYIVNVFLLFQYYLYMEKGVALREIYEWFVPCVVKLTKKNCKVYRKINDKKHQATR